MAKACVPAGVSQAVVAVLLASGTFAATGLLPGGPGTSWARPVAAPLAGSQWRLVEIQSMDDAQGTTRPADPFRYTLLFGADGTAQLRLDCNRARGTWSARAAADPGSGSLSFGPLATTRALCPAPSLGERLGAQVPYVRTYLLKDGRLYLSLLADGGILVWEPLKEGGGPSRTPDHRSDRFTRRPERADRGCRSCRSAGGRADCA
ncbi:META domain-containing protein [Synechococcus sp. CCY 9618]|uniref:META domain-containing protein n=1 Tax=Synechococcus sp. CCY 9618 TaxID=2815602 RepID=UPI001C24EC06|nr:META domain-containing protein [Synechococcus sp. CCY 9618]